MTKVIAIANQKGSVGKTCTAHILGRGTGAETGRRVLLIDLGPQANLTMSLGGSTRTSRGLPSLRCWTRPCGSRVKAYWTARKM